MSAPNSASEERTATLSLPYPTHPVARKAIDPSAVTFDWTPVPDADRFRLQVAEAEDFKSVLYEQPVEPNTSLSLERALPDEAPLAYWRVRAEAEGKHSTWSPPACFSVTEAVQGGDSSELLVDAPPVPLQPAENTPVNPRVVPFTWDTVPKASGYQLQVAPSDDFADPVIDRTFDQVTSVALRDMVPETEDVLYWRIRTLFPRTRPGPWCESVKFNLSSADTSEEDSSTTGSITKTHPSKTSVSETGPIDHSGTSQLQAVVVALFAVGSFTAVVLLTVLLA